MSRVEAPKMGSVNISVTTLPGVLEATSLGGFAASLALDWYDETVGFIILSRRDLDSPITLADRLGVILGSDESDVVLRLIQGAFSFANTGLFYSVRSGGAKAHSGISGDAAFGEAKKFGIRGNDIKVVIGTGGSIRVYFGHLLVGSGVLDADEMYSDAFIDWEGNVPGTYVFEDGENGTYVASDAVQEFLELLATKNYAHRVRSIGFGFATESINTQISAGLNALIASTPNNVFPRLRTVVASNAIAGSQQAKDEGIPNLHRIPSMDGFVTAGGDIQAWEAAFYLAAMYSTLEGAALATAVELSIFTDIPFVTRIQKRDYIESGFLMLEYGVHGGFRISEDRTSFLNFTSQKDYTFARGEQVRSIDGLLYDITELFDQTVRGKMRNTVENREIYRGMVLIRINRRSQEFSAHGGFDEDGEVIEVAVSGSNVRITRADNPWGINAIITDLISHGAIMSLDLSLYLRTLGV